MPDLTTTHLQYLLDQATPGPWEAKDSDCITSQHGEVLWNTDQAVDWNRNDQDVKLAALAPQLAQEVIRLRDALGYLVEETRLAAASTDLAQEVLRMRRELNSMQRAWLGMVGDPECTPTEQDFAAHVVDHIDSVLGDQDE